MKTHLITSLALMAAATLWSPAKLLFPAAKAASLRPVGQAGQWDLIFDDEFDGVALDETKWYPCFYWGDSSGCGSTTTPNNWHLKKNVRIRNGILRLRATNHPVTINGTTYLYTSGMITTGPGGGAPARFDFTYGYVEIRARAPKGQGLWPAFWTLPTNEQWPPEIDISEILTGNGNTTFTQHMHYHYVDAWGALRDDGEDWMSPVDLAADYHVYGVSWAPDAIRWYVDGVERRVAFIDSQNITSLPLYLLVQLQVGGDWPGEPDSSTPFPSYYDVDYVRVWKTP